MMLLVYVLMADKSTQLYIFMFADLKRQCIVLGCWLEPMEIMSDLESSLISAITQEFPSDRYRRYLFHFCQVCDTVS
jgi:hypothetical protein